MYQEDFVLNNLQWLICHKTKPKRLFFMYIHSFSTLHMSFPLLVIQTLMKIMASQFLLAYKIWLHQANQRVRIQFHSHMTFNCPNEIQALNRPQRLSLVNQT